MVFKKFKEDIVEPYAKSKIVITFYSADTLVWELKNIYNFSCCKLTSFVTDKKK